MSDNDPNNGSKRPPELIPAYRDTLHQFGKRSKDAPFGKKIIP